MNKEPITLNCFNKLKEELIYLKEKKDQRLFQQSQRQGLMEILKKMLNIMQQKKSSLIMKEELLKLMT